MEQAIIRKKVEPMAGRNVLNGVQVIVDYLIREKVPHAFGLCGRGYIQFIDAMYERSHEIKTISVHHESVAGSHGWQTALRWWTVVSLFSTLLPDGDGEGRDRRSWS